MKSCRLPVRAGTEGPLVAVSCLAPGRLPTRSGHLGLMLARLVFRCIDLSAEPRLRKLGEDPRAGEQEGVANGDPGRRF